MVSLSNHEVERVEAWCHDLVLRQAQDEVYYMHPILCVTPHPFTPADSMIACVTRRWKIK